MNLDLRLHQTIEALYSTVPSGLPGQHWQAMFKVIDQFIPLHGAWMGHSQWWLYEDYQEGYQEFYKLPADFAKQYFAISTEGVGEDGDPLVIKSLMTAADTTIRLSEILPAREIRFATDAYLQWGIHFSIGDAVMFHDYFPGTEASMFIAFYRSEEMNDFSQQEHEVLSILKYHMLAAHRLCLQDITRRLDKSPKHGHLMVIDALGLIYHIEDRTNRLLQSKDASAKANQLPSSFLDALNQGKPTWRGILLDVEPIGEKGLLVVNLSLEEDNPSAKLTASERKVESLLCQGLTIKQVAQEMNIAVSTASGYSKKVYAKLGVSGKHELVRRV